MCRPDMDDLPHHEWKCLKCGAFNSMFDAECQYCFLDPDEDPEATLADHQLDHRKHSR
jgi:hypothetical protein